MRCFQCLNEMETRKNTYRCSECRKVFSPSDFPPNYLNIGTEKDGWTAGHITRQLIMDMAMVNAPVVDFNYSGRNVEELEGERPFEKLLGPNLRSFKTKYNQDLGDVLGDFLSTYLKRAGVHNDYAVQVHNQVNDDGIVEKSPQASIYLKDQEPSESPHLFIAVGAPFYQCLSVIGFGFTYGQDITKDDRRVSIVTRDSLIADLVDSTYNNNKKLQLGFFNHDLVGGYCIDVAPHIDRTDENSFRHGWDHHCSFIEGYSFNNFPKNIEGKITKTFDGLWGMFDTLSRAH